MSTVDLSGPLSIGVDFGGTSVKIGLVQAGVLVERVTPIPTLEFSSANALLEVIYANVDGLRMKYPSIVALGAGLPGIVDSFGGIVHHLTNVPGWVNVPLRQLLSDRTGLPSVIENDANAMTYAEWKYGAGRDRANVICVTLGTGVGGGLILEGRLFRGSRLGAGEIGNMSIDYRGVPGHYGNYGALEQYVGNHQIAERAVKFYEAAGQTRSLLECTPALLAAAATAGDAVAQQLWEETGVMLGSALSDVIWLLNPDAIVLGGGVAKAGELVFGPIRRTIRERTSPVFYEELKILPAELGNDAGIIGCGNLAVDALVEVIGTPVGEGARRVCRDRSSARRGECASANNEAGIITCRKPLRLASALPNRDHNGSDTAHWNRSAAQRLREQGRDGSPSGPIISSRTLCKR